MRGEGIPEMRCAREEGGIEMFSTTERELNCVGVLINRPPGYTSGDR